MTNKEKYIRAFRETIKKYRKECLRYDLFFNRTDCAICNVGKRSECYGCPMVRPVSSTLGVAKYTVILPGCIKGESYVRAHDAYRRYHACRNVGNYKDMTRELKIRADVLELMIPHLEKLPPERFTKRGFKQIYWKLLGID